MARLTIITTPDLAPGFALTGAQVFSVSEMSEAEHVLRQQMAENPDALIACHEPYFLQLPADLRERIHLDYRPLVMALPDGLPARGEVSRRQMLTEMLSQVIGYSISFRAEGEHE